MTDRPSAVRALDALAGLFEFAFVVLELWRHDTQFNADAGDVTD